MVLHSLYKEVTHQNIVTDVVIALQNAERVRKLALQRRNNVIVGSLIGLGVLSIYGYSIYSVKQEKFLDELE